MKLATVLFCVFASVAGDSPTIRVEEGELAGRTYTLPNGRVVNAFFGVPYAAPPVHKYRFKEPQHLKPWVGVWNASIPSSACLQIENSQRGINIVGEEDCLYLNVYTPKLPVNGVSPLLNVFAHIHGGAFMYGSGDIYLPEYILQEEDVVYVSINYRLGVLGFFSTNDDVAPGNFGLKDQVAALKWIQRNIIYFGGSPSAVTLVGCSAGGASVHYHYLSPLSDGLFQKGISLSGSVLLPWTLPRNIPQKSTHIAALIGCPTNTTRDMVKCLRRRPARAIVEQANNFLAWRYNPFTSFGPVVEPANTTNAFLTESPLNLLKAGKVKDLPWMTSLNEKEGLYPGAEFLPDDEILKQLNDNWNEIAPHLLMYNYSVPDSQKEEVASKIRNFYIGDKAISKETSNELIQMFGDRFFFNGIIDAVRLHNSVTQANNYCYKFHYRGKYSLTNVYAKNFENYGVSHADDLAYVLSFLGSSAQETDDDRAMVKLLCSAFMNFIKTGNPNFGSINWEPMAKSQNPNLTCLGIYSPTSLQMEQVTNPTSEFWKNLLPQEYAADSIPLKDEL